MAKPAEDRVAGGFDPAGRLMVFSPGLQGVTDQTGNQPAKGKVLLLGGLP